jgi:rhomboid protease GluP
MQNPQQNQQPKSQQPSSGQLILRLPTTRPLLTYVLLGIIALVFLAQMITNQLVYPSLSQPLLDFGAIDFQRILNDGEYYRLFTAMFLHISTLHVFFNGLALWAFGQSVERFFGHARFGVIYLLGGLSGSIASFIFTHGRSVGASAAIFAIFGAEMVFLYLNRQLLGRAALRELRSLIILAALNLAIGLFTVVVPGGVIIDNWAHVGGFFGGTVLAWFIAPQLRLQTDSTAPSGYRIVDGNPPAKTWTTPLIFGIALIAALVYAVMNMRV